MPRALRDNYVEWLDNLRAVYGPYVSAAPRLRALLPGTASATSIEALETIMNTLVAEQKALPSLEVAYPAALDKWLNSDCADNADFLDLWNFLAAVVLRPQEVDDFIDMQEEVFTKDLKRYGDGRARFLYRKRALASAWPHLNWALHRLIALEAIRHFFRS